MSVVERALRRWALALEWGPSPREPRGPLASPTPGERARLSSWRRVAAYLAAVVAPLLVAVALVPVREPLDRSTAAVLTLPVVAVALLGGTRPGLVAALSAGLAFDVLHTEPYGTFHIDDRNDLVATVVLVIVAAAIGAVAESLVRMATAASVRQREIDHLVIFARQVAAEDDPERLAAAACSHLTALLRLRSCEWRPGYHGTAAAVLLPDGGLAELGARRRRERAVLPSEAELPVEAAGREVGRFLLRAGDDEVSLEERRTGAAVAQIFADALEGHAGGP